MRSSSSLEFIRDPRVDLPNAELLARADLSLARLTRPNFSDNLEAAKISLPNLGPEVEVHSFVLRLGHGWTVDGHRSVVHQSGAVLLDSVFTGNLASAFTTDSDTSIEIGEDRESFFLGEYTRRVVDLPPRTGLALGVEPSNWGSFITRILPKAIMLKEIGAEYLLAFCRHERQREMLNLAGWDDDHIIEFKPQLRHRISDALLPSEPTTHLYVHPEALARMRSLARPHDSDLPNKIFVSRRGGVAAKRSRYCLNGEDFAATVRSFGFKEIYADTLTSAEQVQLFSHASAIIGPSGAGMFNAGFARPHTTVIDIESEPHWIFGHSNLFSSFGHDFGFLGAKATPTEDGRHLPYEVDTALLASRLAALEL